jgi:hypothetical protein
VDSECHFLVRKSKPIALFYNKGSIILSNYLVILLMPSSGEYMLIQIKFEK